MTIFGLALMNLKRAAIGAGGVLGGYIGGVYREGEDDIGVVGAAVAEHLPR